MLNFDELHRQNHRITELSQVFLYLAERRDLCDSETVCGLFFEYLELVHDHLERVDLLVQKHLQTLNTPQARTVARKLMVDSALLRRNFLQYVGRWTEASHAHMRVAADHQSFLGDSQELFQMFLDRLQRETELLYPLLRNLDQGSQLAA
jgi:hypothetical protein